MFETLFGAEMPLAARFLLAFLIVLGLIGATAWAVRRFGAGRLGSSGSRGRQPRLAVIDYASVDGRRRLILVRRDNVEHLLMIGGPTDVVVESNIVRAVAAPRDVPAPRPPAPAESVPRAVPLPDSGNGSWPLQPESTSAAPVARPVPRIEPVPEQTPAWPLQPTADTTKRPQRETLAALADEIAPRPGPPRSRTTGIPRAQPVEPRVEPRLEQQTETAGEPEPAPRAEARSGPRIAAVQPEPAEAAAVDQSLAEMAQRLEAALRKPNAQAEARQNRAPSTPPRVSAPAEPAATPPRPAPPENAAPPPEDAAVPTPPASLRPGRPPEPKRAEGKPNQSKTLYDSLEQEMASLLGRPTNKT